MVFKSGLNCSGRGHKMVSSLLIDGTIATFVQTKSHSKIPKVLKIIQVIYAQLNELRKIAKIVSAISLDPGM